MPNNLSLDPLEIVNTTNDPISDAINNVLPKNMSTVAQSGVEGMNTGGAIESEEVVEQPMNYSPIRTETTQSHSAEQYQQQQARLDALIASGKDPSQFDINGTPLGTYGGQVSAQQYMSSIAKPREVNEEYYTPEDYINLLKSDELGSTEYSGNTVINYKALPEGGYGSFITAGGGDLGFSINEQGLTKEQAKSIFNNYVNEVGGELQLGNMLGVGGIGAKGDMVQRDDGTWTFKFEDPSVLNQFGDVVGALSKAGLMYATGGAIGGLASSALGVSSAVGAGIGAGTVSLAQGDSLDEALVKGFTAGLSEYAEGATGALEAAQAAGESAEVIKGLQAASDVANNVKNVINIGQAIESGNILKGLSSGMDLAGIGSLVDYTEDVIAESLGETAGMGIDGALTEWTFYNSDHIAEATVKFADTLIKGGNLGDATVGAVKEYITDGGGIKDLIPSGGNFSIDFETPEVIQQVAQMIADGASAINSNVIKPALEGADQLVRDLPTTKKDWQEAEDYVNQNIIDPTAETVREFGRDVRDALPEGPDLDFPDFDFPSLSGGQYVGGGGYSGDKADLVTVQLTDPELVKGFEYDSLNNPLMNRRAI